MDVPLQISFRNMDASDAVRAKVQERAEKLEKYYGHVTSCRVVIEAPERRHHKDKLYHVRIEIGVPGKRLMVDHAGPAKPAHEDVYVAIRDAFGAATRQLEDYARTLRGEVKAHEVPPHGRVLRIFPDQDHGYVRTADGQEVFFNRNSVSDGAFDHLQDGSEVRISIAPQEPGQELRAQYVRPVGKPHLVDR